MDLFWRLILAHLIADFTLQTNKIATWKRESIWGVLLHSAIFFVVGFVLTFGRIFEVWLNIGGISLHGWVCLGILTILHFVEDNWRVWTIDKFNSPDSLGFFLWDQFIHCLMIFIFTPLDESLIPERWIIIAIIFILASHFTTILIYYVEKNLFNKANIETNLKYYSIIERLIIVSLFLLGGYWWIFMLLLWVIRGVISRIKKIYDFSWLHIVINYTVAIILGLAGRVVMLL